MTNEIAEKNRKKKRKKKRDEEKRIEAYVEKRQEEARSCWRALVAGRLPSSHHSGMPRQFVRGFLFFSLASSLHARYRLSLLLLFYHLRSCFQCPALLFFSSSFEKAPNQIKKTTAEILLFSSFAEVKEGPLAFIGVRWLVRAEKRRCLIACLLAFKIGSVRLPFSSLKAGWKGKDEGLAKSAQDSERERERIAGEWI